MYGSLRWEPEHFFVVVANDNPARDVRNPFRGPVNPGIRQPSDPPTLGERVLDYYGMLATGPDGSAAPVTVVRPDRGNLQDLDSGHNIATTRTQFLSSDLIDRMLRTGRYRLLPIRDPQALAALLPGTIASTIPPGLYGPGRRVPGEPVPTIAVRQLLVARADVPGRVVRDILEVVYSPRFARDVQYGLTEESGRDLGCRSIRRLRSSIAATSRHVGPAGALSLVASAIAGLFALGQFVSRYRRDDRVQRRRRLVADELAKLQIIRQRIVESADASTARDALHDADDVILGAEQDAAVGLLDTEGIQALRSLHRVCSRVAEEPGVRPGLRPEGLTPV